MANSSVLTKNRALIEQVLLAIVIVLMVYLLYLQFRQNDTFQEKKKECPCEPKGIVELNAPECKEDDAPVYENGKIVTCGKLVKKDTARCSDVGVAFDCKLN